MKTFSHIAVAILIMTCIPNPGIEGSTVFTNTGQCPDGYSPEGGYSSAPEATTGACTDGSAANYWKCRADEAIRKCQEGDQYACDYEIPSLRQALQEKSEDYRMQENIRKGVWGK